MCVFNKASRLVHAVLTAVGELHSLTDWQVSEASEEAELVDFWEMENGVKTKWKGKRKRKSGEKGRSER